MGAKDTKAKEYLSDNERFADLCNAVLFDGEQVIKAENLHIVFRESYIFMKFLKFL